MTTPDTANSVPQPVPVPPQSSAPRSVLAPLPETGWRAFVAVLSRERYWFLLLIPYLLAWLAPFRTQDYMVDGILRWCWDRWANSNSALAFQPLVPIGVGMLIWSRREQYAAQWASITRKYPANHPRRRGNALPFVAGCIALIFSYCVQVKGVAIAAQLLIAVGAIYWAYGFMMLRILALPLMFLLLMIPPPDSILERFANKSLQFSVMQASKLLNLFHIPVEATTNVINPHSWFLKFNGYGVEVSVWSADGSGNFICTVAILFWYVIWRRLRPAAGWLLIPLGAVFAVALNIVRIMGAGVFSGPAHSQGVFVTQILPALLTVVFVVWGILGLRRSAATKTEAPTWPFWAAFVAFIPVLQYYVVPVLRHESPLEPGLFLHFLNGWVIVGTAIGLSLLTTRFLLRANTLSPQPLTRAAASTGRGMNKAVLPLANGLAFLGRNVASMWVRSERATEKALRLLFPRNRKRRR